MEIQELLKNILHIIFHNQHDLAATFLRFQEHYESPKFRGTIFTFEEYKQWYIANSPNGKATGRFTYYNDWVGFNIPSEILNPFYQGVFDPLSEMEKMFLEAFNDRRGKELFYVIGTYGKTEISTLKHEVAHGLFYTRPEYKTAVLAILDEIPAKERDGIMSILANSIGYHPSVFDDETHAYILAGNLEQEGIDTSKLVTVAQKLETNFRQFSGDLFNK